MSRIGRAFGKLFFLAAGISVVVTGLDHAAAHPGHGHPTCLGRFATIIGTPGDDLLVGTPGDDVILGGRGDDRILGSHGDDVICGGPGDDRIDGGADHDRVNGGPGDDRIVGRAGPDRILGGPGADILRGNAHKDVITGGPGSDRILGEGSDDRLFGQLGDDRIVGGNHVDHCVGGPGNDTLVECESGSNAAPVANDDTFDAQQDTTLNEPIPGVLGNDTDDGPPPLTANLDTGPTDAAAFTLNADGSFDYTPNAASCGPDTFTYTAQDGLGATSNVATVTIEVNCGPDATGETFDVAAGNFAPAVGNTTLRFANTDDVSTPNVFVAGDLLDNDTDPDGPDPLSVVAFNGSSTQGGDVSVDAAGQFTYTPPVGFEGTDTFTYTIDDGGGGTDDATVTIEVTEMVWWVDCSVASGGDGRSDDPFDALVSLQGADPDEPGDVIFVFDSTCPGGLVLEDDQSLFGQPHGLILAGHILVTPSGSRPVLSGSSGTALTLASGNTVEDIDVVNTAGAGLVGSSVGALTVDDVSVDTMSGVGVSLTGGNTISVHIDAVTVSSSSTGGVHLATNSGTTTFGTLDLTTSGGAGLFASSAGTLAVTDAASTIDATGGPAVNIANTTIGVSGVTFRSVSADGAPNGIVLNDTGASGSFVVTGDGTLARNGSGGTITGTTGDAVSLTSASGVSLRQMNITSCGDGSAGDDCVDSSGGGDHTLSAVMVSGASGTGTNEDFGNGWRLTNVTGDNRIDNDSLFTSFPTASTHAVRMRNTNANGNLTISGSDFTNQGSTNSATFVTVQSFGSSNVDLTVEGTRPSGAGTASTTAFSGLRGDALLSALESGSTGSMDTIVRNVDFLDAAANGSGAIAATVNESGATHNVTIEDNVFRNLSTTLLAPVGVVTTNIATNGGTLNATIQRNDLDIIQGTRRGIQVVAQPVAGATLVGSLTLDINNNAIDRIPGNFAILVDVDDRIGNSTIGITNNQIGQASGFEGQVGETGDGAMLLRTRGTPAATNSITISNNNIRLNTNLGGENDTLGRGVFLDARDDRVSNIDFTGNTIRNDDANSADPEFFARTVSGSPTLCLNLNGNDAIDSSGTSGSGTYSLSEGGGTFNVEDFANVGTNNAGSVVTSGTIGNSANCL